MSIKYKSSLIVLVSLLSCISCNERFRTVIKMKDYLTISEHVYKDMGVKVLANIQNMTETDKYKLIIQQYDVEDYEKGFRKESQSEIYDGTMINNSYRGKLQAKNKRGEYVMITIQNLSERDIELNMEISEYIVGTKKEPDTSFNVDYQDSDHHAMEGHVKYQSLDYIQHLALHMKKIAAKIKQHKEEQLQIEEREMTNLNEISVTVKYFGIISIVSVVVISILMMLTLHTFLRRKKVI